MRLELPCLLCGGPVAAFAEDSRRSYYRCSQCELVFADPLAHLPRSAEKAGYDQHENCPDDPKYRHFLNRLARPLLERLRPGAYGLDFGCGPGPALSVMLEEAGMHMRVYDPFFAPDAGVLKRTYDFVTCSEVVEHFNRPRRAWEQMVGLLRPGGWLGVMTQLADSATTFDTWFYKNDPTHVSFYSTATFAWLSQRFGLRFQQPSASVVLFQKA